MTPRARKPRPRSYDPARTRAALDAEVRAVREAVRVLCAAPDAPELLEAPSGLEGWTVRDLVVHIAICLDFLPRRLAEEPGPATAELDLRGYVARFGSQGGGPAAEVAETAVREAAALPGTGAAVLERFDRAADRLAEAVAETDARSTVRTRFGVMTVDDFLVTRLLEAVVHGDDLTAATGTAVSHDRQALAAVVRLTADALAVKAPGGSVEVRIPPFAVVQCVEGPRHTRGTPPNVVETNPLTWIRLATGRRPWAEALDAAEVSASGERADLSALLPVLG
ncbi:maleylpyruvate isomerase family mycothiol-dependent enzyme [Streptomyces sp. F63]|uniref:sterol carrier family protein n=1 Tax=Streptomyces sp. F63 TaxID=2824887 RepID=UPI001B391519|nr:sterol carrier family protein [Streptomyces sp. F63]MBQ0982994.1 maleylpyruvate isomerase family mycothiol-dependent enzyme [Streptomyces sp. F63]